MAISLDVLLTACSSETSPSRGSVQRPLEAFPSGYARDGLALRNGGSVTLAENLNAEVFLDPFPATAPTSWLDLYLERQGQPVDNAQITSDNEMAYMSHGASQQTARNSGGGHYLLALEYPMVGPWHHRLSIRVAEQRYELPISVTAYP